jgi:hypothetical protein
MAILFPSPNLKGKNVTNGERLFALRLQKKLEDDYFCWFDVPVGRKQLRPDFIVLHPGRGILILEVKDWKLDSMRQIDAKTVELLTDRGIKHEVNPLEQARAYALEVKELLERDPFLVEQEHPRYKGRLLFPWGYGAVLTGITRKQFEAAQLDLAIPGDKVICKDEMTEGASAMEFQERLWAMFHYNFGSLLTLSRIDRIRWHLFPEVRIDQGGLFATVETPAVTASTAQTGSPTKTTAIIEEIIPELITVMDKEQERVARDLGEGHRLIHGVAGSGKTLILAHRAIQLSAAGLHKPILVLCYNKALAGRLAELLAAKGAGNNVQIRHFHAWCKEMCALYQLDLAALPDAPIYEQQVHAVIQGVEKGRVPPAQYAAILIDEGHDFEVEWFRLIVQMLDPATDSLLLVYDDVQSIYKRKKPESWASVGVKAKGRSRILKVNYRNTAEALDVAYQFVTDYLDAQSSSEDIPLVKPEVGLRHGRLPQIMRFSSLDEELGALASWFKRRHENKGLPFSSMAVLCRFNNQIGKVCDAFKAHQVPAQSLESRPANRKPAQDAVQVLTMHSSKGLEFNSVAIPDLGCMPYKNADEADEGRVLYVAMTRATHELLLSFHSESTFSRKLLQAIADNEKSLLETQ